MGTLTKAPKSIYQKTQQQGFSGPDQLQITTELSGNGNIKNSDDSPLSDTPNTLYVDDKMHGNATGAVKDELQDPHLKQAILTIALDVSPNGRRREMPDYFDMRGRLHRSYKLLNEEIREARDRRKSTKQQRNFERNPNTQLADGPSRQLEDESRKVENSKRTLASSRQKPLNDTANMSAGQQSHRKKLRSDSLFSGELVDSSGGSSIHGESQLILSNGRKLRGPKTSSTAVADTRSGIQEQFRTVIDPQPSSNDASKIRQMTRVSKLNASNHATAGSPIASEPSRKLPRLDGAYNAAALPLQAPSAMTVVAYAEERDQQTAVSAVHDTLQRQIERSTKTCSTCQCHESSCSCDPSQRPAEEIMCNGDLCFKMWFTNEFLEKYLGIHMRDAQDQRRDYGFWSCPMCSFKKAKQDARGPNGFVSPRAIPKFGSDALEDEEVRQYLNEFWGLISQYIRMVSKSSIPPCLRMQPLLQVPCVRNEISDERYHPLIYVLRRLLKVDPGRFVKDAVVDLQLQDLEPSIWMRGSLVFLFCEFVFKSRSPFDDVSIWRKGLVHSFEPEVAETWVQDNRIRTMKDGTGEYQRRCKDQHERHIRQLNAAMLPLIGGIGGNEGLHRIHMRIAEIAEELNAKFSAYTGTYEAIMPEICDLFDPKYHVSDDPLDEFKDLSGRLIMLTTMVGVQFHIPGKEWRICSRAKVRLWPSLDQGPASPGISLPSAPDRRGGSRKRPYHDSTSR